MRFKKYEAYSSEAQPMVMQFILHGNIYKPWRKNAYR
jgi:hypothetical protein